LERKAIGLVLAIIGVASIGGIVEIAPLFTIPQTVEDAPDMRVYTPLELAGRNIYIREGCYACHSQMIRTLRDEVERYGPYSLAVESKYDHPMLWGSFPMVPWAGRVRHGHFTFGELRKQMTLHVRQGRDRSGYEPVLGRGQENLNQRIRRQESI
jgi:cbb3-type cytochrome c oxidase subunit II